jgi:predicted metalloendopeptidase
VQYDDEQTRDAATEMLAYVLGSFRTLIGANSWMDAATRQYALRKLAAIRPLIAAPQRWQSTIPPDAVHSADHLGNAVRVLAAMRSAQLASVCAPADRYTWQMAPYEVNAYYSPTANDIVFPEGILQRPFFNASAPLAANYGGLGSVMGHEVGHAFDDTGRQFDWDGNEHDWWSAASAAAFEDRAQCVVQLYDGLSAYPTAANTTAIVVDGALTLGENWADLTGLSAAFAAYRAARAAQPARTRRLAEALVRAVFGYNEDQLFFRAWASHWCSHVVRAEAYELALEDTHAPSRWRVNVPAMQSDEFRRAFGCRTTSNASLCALF